MIKSIRKRRRDRTRQRIERQKRLDAIAYKRIKWKLSAMYQETSK